MSAHSSGTPNIWTDRLLNGEPTGYEDEVHSRAANIELRRRICKGKVIAYPPATLHYGRMLHNCMSHCPFIASSRAGEVAAGLAIPDPDTCRPLPPENGDNT